MRLKAGHQRRRVVHALRLMILLGIIACIHLQYRKLAERFSATESLLVDVEAVRSMLPAANSVTATGDGMPRVSDDAGQAIGYVVQTSPISDRISGFSGPTNVLIAMDAEYRVAGMQILSSGDTRDHVEQIEDDPKFLKSLNGQEWKSLSVANVDAVSGATLTSYAILESVANRLGEKQPSLRFPEPISLEDVQRLFAEADHVVADDLYESRFKVLSNGKSIGSIVDSSPATDNLAGYQGPTRTLIGFDRDGKIVGIVVGKSYDNLPYTDYVRDEDYFLHLFDELTIAELSDLDLREHGVEGVSGATMTSMAVADGMKLAATQNIHPTKEQAPKPARGIAFTFQDAGTIAVLLFGIVFAFTKLRGKRWLRNLFRVTVVVWLGFLNGALISQVMLVGWTNNGIPWRSAIGLVLLTLAAFIIPIATKNNIYCNHLCPHGAIQQLLVRRPRFRVKLSRRTTRVLSMVPSALLLLVAIVAMLRLSVSWLDINLVDIEPFDAYLFRIAGWSSIVIAVAGLIASLFVPMAYCRFGCPTGALIGFTRFHARADKFGTRDWFAGLVLMGCFAILVVS